MSIDKQIQLVHYSEKACAVFGNTRDFKDDLKQLGGKFNMNLIKRDAIMSDNGRDCIGESQKTEPGWIFPMQSYDKIKTYIETGNLDLKQQNMENTSITITRFAFDKLIDRISSLENEIKLLKQKFDPGTNVADDTVYTVDNGGGDDDGSDKPIRKRLLRKKV